MATSSQGSGFFFFGRKFFLNFLFFFIFQKKSIFLDFLSFLFSLFFLEGFF